MSEIEALAAKIVSDAIIREAKQVWVQPQRDCVRIRARFDRNTIEELFQISRDQAVPLVTHLKRLAGLNTSVTTAIQRGYLAFSVGETEHLLWTVALPTMHGEKIVIWIASNEGLMPELRLPTHL